ncbi:MAG: hypothetical protein RL632_591, partial [Bacteroidota bacterium]
FLILKAPPLKTLLLIKKYIFLETPPLFYANFGKNFKNGDKKTASVSGCTQSYTETH